MGEVTFIYQLIKLLLGNSRNREIKKKYNGVNAKYLASEYGMSVNNIKNIIKQN